VHRVAGEIAGPPRPGDVTLPGLALPANELGGGTGDVVPPSPAELHAVLDGADLLVVENLLSLPLNEPAADALVKVLDDRGGRAVLHHHDLPWQRDRTRQIASWPPDPAGAVHVTINDLSRRELRRRRGIAATVIRNAFDLDAPLGDRGAGRATIGAGPDEIVVLHPVRAIPRKNIPGALALCEALAGRLGAAVRYWLPGPAEEGYGPTLATLLASTTVPVSRQPAPSMADAYAASDLVVFPSHWEGFGNPVIESAGAGRPLAVRAYPVFEEIAGFGFEFLDAADPDAVAAWLRAPDPRVLARNRAIARHHFSLPSLVERLDHLLES
jgi:glycosyltransferase involved in cell wall biosynthesis